MDPNDKTVFTPGQRQPNQSEADRTLFIPTPGARPAAAPTPPPAQAAPSYAQAAPMPASTELPQLQQGVNPVISAAATLLAVLSKLRNTLQHGDVAGLHRQLVDEIKRFDARLKQQNSRPEIALAARYQLCSALDEAVLNTPWGAQAGWSQRSLLSLFHKETFGGEKFFAILAKMLEAPGTNLEILELNYLLLSLGFEGKYRIDPRGRDRLESLRDNLYSTIEKLRGDFPLDLSPRGDSGVKVKKGLVHYLPLWVVTAVVLAILLMSYAGFRVWVYQSTEPAAQQLQTLSQELLKPAN